MDAPSFPLSLSLPVFSEFRDGSNAQLDGDTALPQIPHAAPVDALPRRPADGQPGGASGIRTEKRILTKTVSVPR